MLAIDHSRLENLPDVRALLRLGRALVEALLSATGGDPERARRPAIAISEWVGSVPVPRPQNAIVAEYRAAGRDYAPPARSLLGHKGLQSPKNAQVFITANSANVGRPTTRAIEHLPPTERQEVEKSNGKRCYGSAKEIGVGWHWLPGASSGRHRRIA